MGDANVELSIGQVARRLGVPVRTVRFWSDENLAGPVGRTASGYRTYDATALARLDLLVSLRQLGLSLPAARSLLQRQRTVQDVAAEHVRALDAELRLLRLRRALLHHLSTTTIHTEELSLMNNLATLSTPERQQMIDEFLNRAFAGLPDGAPGGHLAAAMRTLPSELPQDPTSEQVSAWLELAQLVQDPGFADRVRELAMAGPMATPEDPDAMYVDMGRLNNLGRQALEASLDPGSPRSQQLIAELLDDGRPPVADRRARLADRLETFTDTRVERYGLLLDLLNGCKSSDPIVPGIQWVTEALRR